MKVKLFIAILLIPVLFGCSKESMIEKKLTGEWYLSKRIQASAIPPTYSYDKSNTPEILIFHEDGKYERIYRSSQETESGEWIVSDGNNDYDSSITFIENDKNGFVISETTYNIITCKKDELFIELQSDGNTRKKYNRQ